MNLDREHAQSLDAADALRAWRERFVLPQDEQGRELVYLCGHSLGAQPTLAAEYVEEVMRDWRSLGVDGHFAARHAWTSYHERAAPALANLVGAERGEVVAMNTLTVNLHLMLASFYRPAGERTALLIERQAFPSDRHAAESQVRFHGLDPARDLIEVEPRPGEDCLRTEDLIAVIEREGARIATVLLPGVQYLTGQVLDVPAITSAARRAGCTVGWDLAHAIGNVPVALHDTGADFAVWCHYKYVNGGPGAVGGAFVHARHAHRTDLPRFAGWWGHDRATRFRMDPEFVAMPGADGAGADHKRPCGHGKIPEYSIWARSRSSCARRYRRALLPSRRTAPPNGGPARSSPLALTAAPKPGHSAPRAIYRSCTGLPSHQSSASEAESNCPYSCPLRGFVREIAGSDRG